MSRRKTRVIVMRSAQFRSMHDRPLGPYAPSLDVDFAVCARDLHRGRALRGARGADQATLIRAQARAHAEERQGQSQVERSLNTKPSLGVQLVADYAAIGTVKVNVLPSPGVDWTVISPSCMRAIS